MSKKEHLTKMGFKEILTVISKMNTSGTRKYDPVVIRDSQHC